MKEKRAVRIAIFIAVCSNLSCYAALGTGSMGEGFADRIEGEQAPGDNAAGMVDTGNLNFSGRETEIKYSAVGEERPEMVLTGEGNAVQRLDVRLPGEPVVPPAAVTNAEILPSLGDETPRAPVTPIPSIPSNVPGLPHVSFDKGGIDGFFDGSLLNDSRFTDLDNSNQWYDQSTQQWETEASKVDNARQLALSSPLGSAIGNALTYGVPWKVDRRLGNQVGYVIHTTGDNHPQDAVEINNGSINDPYNIWTAQAIRDLPLEYMASKIASMWIRHLVKNTIPQSAEKTYTEGSVLIRVFRQLVGGGTVQKWYGTDQYGKKLDNWSFDPNDVGDGAGGFNFDIFRHYYAWLQGFQYADVRQGPYFLQKIMQALGSPIIYTDAAGRRNLFGRYWDSKLPEDLASNGQQEFLNFVSNENRGQ